jgi:hypothetical protein
MDSELIKAATSLKNEARLHREACEVHGDDPETISVRLFPHGSIKDLELICDYILEQKK